MKFLKNYLPVLFINIYYISHNPVSFCYLVFGAHGMRESPDQIGLTMQCAGLAQQALRFVVEGRERQLIASMIAMMNATERHPEVVRFGSVHLNPVGR